jgi:hypothetical protein
MSNMFNLLLEKAGEQSEPQRLLFLFAKADGASKKPATEKDPKSGTLEPKMCVDKVLDELSDFDSLVKEADNISADWSFVFIAGLSGSKGKAPTTDEAEQYLNKMTHDVTIGQNIANYVIMDRSGQPIEMMVS